ncbi:hypothetical protein DFH06DRAFT_1293946 [Mycena polygramma]|nr:hypothetical protein DFH06DRAFT_1293946 [Mycena polygramma]
MSAIKIPMQDATRKSSPSQVNCSFVNIRFTSNLTASCTIQVQTLPKTSSSSSPSNLSTSGGAFKSQDVVKLYNSIISVHRSVATLQVRDKVLAHGSSACIVTP